MIRFQPQPALRSRVASIDLLGGGLERATVLPSAGSVLGVQLHGRILAEGTLLSTAGVTGIQSHAREYTYVEDTASLLVRFTPQGAACLGVPASELTDRSWALDDILSPAQVREGRERMLEARTDREKVAAMEAFLLDLPLVRDPLVTRALQLLDSSPEPEARVATVASAVGLSERQLERRVLQRVGITPKRYVVLRRLERAVALLESNLSMTRAAHLAGYYDQSHFIREFRRFTGTSPKRFLQR